MKKASLILLVVFLTAATFLGGLFLGRYLNRSEVRISQNETTVPSSSSKPETTEPVPEDGLVDINTASVLELSTLPTIGDVIAQRIVDYRTEHGPFQSVGQLTAVEGIGEKRLEAILDYITIGGQS
jgi:competence protein ComEA